MVQELVLNNGVTMPALGLGVFQSPPAETADAVEAALKVGYRHVDTAAVYGNEREVGEGIRRSGILAGASVMPAVNQIELHPYFAQPDVQQADAEHGILTQAWSPIGGITFYPGWGEDRRNVLQDPTIGEIAAGLGRTPAQVMLRWQVQHGRSAIPKSTNPGRIAENFDIDGFELTPGQMASIDALDRGVRNGPDPVVARPEAFGRVIPEE